MLSTSLKNIDPCVCLLLSKVNVALNNDDAWCTLAIEINYQVVSEVTVIKKMQLWHKCDINLHAALVALGGLKQIHFVNVNAIFCNKLHNTVHTYYVPLIELCFTKNFNTTNAINTSKVKYVQHVMLKTCEKRR